MKPLTLETLPWVLGCCCLAWWAFTLFKHIGYALAAAASFTALAACVAVRRHGWRGVKWYGLPASLLRCWWRFAWRGTPTTILGHHAAWRGVFRWTIWTPKK